MSSFLRSPSLTSTSSSRATAPTRLWNSGPQNPPPAGLHGHGFCLVHLPTYTRTAPAPTSTAAGRNYQGFTRTITAATRTTSPTSRTSWTAPKGALVFKRHVTGLTPWEGTRRNYMCSAMNALSPDPDSCAPRMQRASRLRSPPPHAPGTSRSRRTGARRRDGQGIGRHHARRVSRRLTGLGAVITCDTYLTVIMTPLAPEFHCSCFSTEEFHSCAWYATPNTLPPLSQPAS